MKSPRMRFGWLLIAALAVPAAAQEAGAHSHEAETQEAGTPTETTPSAGGKIELTPAEWDFGVKWYGEEAAAEVVMKNVGTGPLTIKNVRSSCGCTVAKPTEGTWNGKVLAPGATEVIKLSYNTKKAARKVSQTITIESDDSTSPRYALKVSGEVKQAFDIKPAERVVFASIERDSAVTETVELSNNMDQPIQLKLKDSEIGKMFDIKLDEIEAGKKYKLSVSTRPPLKVGPNAGTIVLETGLEKNPEISIPVSAYIAPRVAVSPPRLFVSPKVATPFERIIRVTHKADNPLQIKEIKSSSDKITAEVMPPKPNATAGRTMSFIEIKVKLPAGTEFPADGAKLEIFTNDSDPEYQKLTVDITMRDLSAAKQPTVVTEKPAAAGEEGEAAEEPKKEEDHP